MADAAGSGAPGRPQGHNATTVVCRQCGQPVALGAFTCQRCAGGSGPSAEEDQTERVRTRLQAAIGTSYQLLELLGRGGMGIVFRAREVALDREVALKVLTIDPLLAPDAFGRFEREAKLAARLDHPGIVPIFSVGSGDGIAFYTMRLVRGGTLESLMGERRMMEVQRTISILREVAAALDYAHARGIVHRDIKPANILIGDTGHAAVADFGIARALGGSNDSTGTSIIGSPGYMSPEQWRGDEVDGRADQYALGIVAFEMLAGRRPFEHPRVQDMMQLHIAGEVPDIRQVRSGLDAAAGSAIQRVLAKVAGERFPSATAFVEALAGRRPSVAVQRTSRAISVTGPQRRSRLPMAPLFITLIGVATAFALPQTRPRALEFWQAARSEAITRGTQLAVGAGLMIPPEEAVASASDSSAINADSLEREIRAMLSDTTSSTAAFSAPGDSVRVPLAPLGVAGDSSRALIVDPVELARARGSHRRVEGGEGYARVTFAGGIARVRIDGQQHGWASSIPAIVALDSGRHVVSLLASAYTPLNIELDIQPGDTATAAFRLPPRAQTAETTAVKPPAPRPGDTSMAAAPPTLPPPAAAPPPV